MKKHEEPKRGIAEIAEQMDLYLKKYKLKSTTDNKAFIADYFRLLFDKAIQTGNRIPLPLNLGYIQGLEHLYEGRDIEHIKTFGNLDYSLVWIKHPLWRNYIVETSLEISERLRARRKEGLRYLTEYVDGDSFVWQ